MEISNRSTGASVYAMKKALDIPKTLLDMIQDTRAMPQPPAISTNSMQAQDTTTVTGKGAVVDIIA